MIELFKTIKGSGQSKGELGGTEFPHLLNLAFIVTPPPIFSLCSSPTWIQLLSINYLLKSQWVTVNMLLVVSISHQNLESTPQQTLRGVLILLTYKKLYYGLTQLYYLIGNYQRTWLD